MKLELNRKAKLDAKFHASLVDVISYFIAFGLFMQILILPGILKPLKLPFIAIILLIAVFSYAIKRNIFVHKYTLILFGLYLARSIQGIIVGYFNEAPGLFILLPLNVYYVILYLITLSLVFTEDFFLRLIEILFMGTFAIVAMDLYYIIS